MLKRIWEYLWQETPSAREHMQGLRILMIVFFIVVLAPLAYHTFIPEEKESISQQKFDSLQTSFLRREDSILKLKRQGQKYKKWVNYNSGIEDESNRVLNEYQSQTNENNDQYRTQSFEKSFSRKEISKFNLNSATLEDLLGVNGIGQVFAERITKYRESLGGFHDQNQLMEVYKIDSTAVRQVWKHLEGDMKPYKKLKINKDDFKILLQHPYLEYEDVKLIFKNRPIGSLEALKRIFPKRYLKLEPYIDYQL